MDTTEIEVALKGRLGPFSEFKGVYSSDTLPLFKFSSKPFIIITNTLSSKSDVNLVGHWVAFYISFQPKKQIVFFDSYGLSPLFYSRYFSTWLNYYTNFSLKEFGCQIQPDTSQKCGLYVILFTHFISHYGMSRFCSFYRTCFNFQKLKQNDVLVTSYFFKKIIKRNLSCSPWKMKQRKDRHALTYKECLFYQDTRKKGTVVNLLFLFRYRIIL